MSYNIDTFKLKELKDFSFPVAALYESKKEDWHPDRVNNNDGSVTFNDMETTLHGTIQGEIFHMTEILCHGEGSGYIMRDILEPAFKQSKGLLEASLVWEGGDSINKIRVEDGVITWTDIEI